MDEQEFPDVAKCQSDSIGNVKVRIETSASSADVVEETMATAIGKGWAGVMIAGAIYPMVALILMAIPAFFFNPPFPISVLEVLIGFVIFGTGIGFIFSGLMSIPAVGLFLVVNWTLDNTFSFRTGVSICGGLTGFFSTLWISFEWSFWKEPFEFAIGSFFIFLAMAMGQFAWSWLASANGAFRPKPNSPVKPQFQFQIRHLLVSMAWVGTVLCLDRLVRDNSIIILVTLYVGLQAILLFADAVFFRLRTNASLRLY